MEVEAEGEAQGQEQDGTEQSSSAEENDVFEQRGGQLQGGLSSSAPARDAAQQPLPPPSEFGAQRRSGSLQERQAPPVKHSAWGDGAFSAAGTIMLDDRKTQLPNDDDVFGSISSTDEKWGAGSLSHSAGLCAQPRVSHGDGGAGPRAGAGGPVGGDVVVEDLEDAEFGSEAAQHCEGALSAELATKLREFERMVEDGDD